MARQKKPVKVGKRPKVKVRVDDVVELIKTIRGGTTERDGSDQGTRGKVLRVLPYSNKVVVQNVNVRVKHLQKTKESPKGGRIEREAPIDLSNVKVISSARSSPT